MKTRNKYRCLNPDAVAPDAILPNVDYISMDFYWIAIQDLWGKESCDFTDSNEYIQECFDNLDDYVPGINQANLQIKYDECGQNFIDSIETEGFKDPIWFVKNKVENGHHRLAVAWKAGYTHVPYSSRVEAGLYYSGVDSNY